MKKTVLLLCVLLLFLSCEKKQVYRNFDNNLEASRWKEQDFKMHSFEIIDDTLNYSIFIEISHVLGTEMNEFPVSFEVTNPNGSVENGEVLVNFKNSDCSGDICDVKFLVKEKIKLKKGKYKVRFAPKSKFGFVPNIIGVGLTIEKQE